MTNEIQTEEKILNAAKKVFHKKGFYGARMQEIADEAGINKAMLHYYFRSKDKLHKKVISDSINVLISAIRDSLDNNLSFEENIELFIDRYIDTLKKEPLIPVYVIHEMAHNPEQLPDKIDLGSITEIETFLMKLGKKSKEGHLIKGDPRQIFISLLGLCLFPFFARPLLQSRFNFSHEEYEVFLEERKEFLKIFFLKAIKVEKL